MPDWFSGQILISTIINEAVNLLLEDDVITSVLGEHVLEHFVAAKKVEWDEYRTQVSQWELDKYLSTF